MKSYIFGCRVNKYHSENWIQSPYLEKKEGVFIASCVVTQKAKRKWISTILKEMKHLPPGHKIYITGCGVLKQGKVENNFFSLYPELAPYKENIELLPETPKYSSHAPKEKPSLFTKKFILIQTGCDNQCSFCLTYQKRGPHRSRPIHDILEEIQAFEEKQGKEIVLTGINIGAWGCTKSYRFHESNLSVLLQEILKHTSIPRIRLSSLGPEYITDALIETLAHPRILPHFHLSIQSGSDAILQKMKRLYSAKHVEHVLQALSSLGPTVSIGADIIVGFPGETESDFSKTYALIENFPITKTHIFPFSCHATPQERIEAASFDHHIDESTKQKRYQLLQTLSETKRAQFIQKQASYKHSVLVETYDGTHFEGWTENYILCSEKNFSIEEGLLQKNEIITGYLTSSLQ